METSTSWTRVSPIYLTNSKESYISPLVQSLDLDRLGYCILEGGTQYDQGNSLKDRRPFRS